MNGLKNKRRRDLLVHTFLAKCLKSSVLEIRPSLQSGFRYGFKQDTIH